MIRLVLLGPPGCGKGTQAEKLSAEFGLKRIATGDMLREEISAETEVGRRVRETMESGELVPDGVVLDLVARRVKEAEEGYILDGFPRNASQARALDRLLEEDNAKLDLVMALDVDDEAIVDRLKGRVSCPDCGAVYNLAAAPPRRDGMCDVCGAALVKRDDDREETIRERLRVYRERTEVLRAYYADKGILKDVDGRGEVDQVYERVKSAVARLT